MRLLHTREFRFQEFFNDDSPFSKIPPYAILSHRWGDEEVSYHEFLHLTGNSVFQPTKVTMETMNSSDHIKAGFMKVVDACHKATEESLNWIWVDTCCIDKSSGAELSEAINSMHSFYRDAPLCYAFLAVVENGLEDRQRGLPQFRTSDWFTRGWTLQELLAPRTLVFVDRKWRFFGRRDQFEEAISEITRIPIDCLGSLSARKEKSIATKMGWAANRQTSMVEDKAYCLLGLFDVNMPLLYGEGFKAFERLQEEIMRQSDDESIFVHKHSSHLSPLAYSPADFADSRMILPGTEVERGSYEFRETDIGLTSYTVTNKGIQMRAAFVGGNFYIQGGRTIALNCRCAERPVLLPVQRTHFDRATSNDDSTLYNPQLWRGIGLPIAQSSCPETYIVDLPKSESSSEQGVRAAERYLTSWTAAGGINCHGEPFVCRTIYLASGYFGRSRGMRGSWIKRLG